MLSVIGTVVVLGLAAVGCVALLFVAGVLSFGLANRILGEEKEGNTN
jgi:hypothetical protein